MAAQMKLFLWPIEIPIYFYARQLAIRVTCANFLIIRPLLRILKYNLHCTTPYSKLNFAEDERYY